MPKTPRMLVSALVAALATSAHARCMDSYLALGMHQQRPARETAGGRAAETAADTIRAIDEVITPPGHVIGFLYVTADGGRFFGTRTHALEPADGKPYVRRIFLRDGLVPRSQLDAILATQDGNAVIYVPNEARLFSALQLTTKACVTAPQQRAA